MPKPKALIHRLLDSFFKYSLGAVLLFIPLYPKFPLLTLPFTYVQIRSEDFLIAFVWVVFFARVVISKAKIHFPPISFQIFVYLIVGVVSSLSAILITQNVRPAEVFLHLIRRVEYLSVFFLLYNGLRSLQVRKYYFQLLLLPLAGVFLYGLAQIYLQAPVISTMNVESSKGAALTLRPGVPLSSTFAGHYDLAIYLIMMLSVISAYLFTIKNKVKFLLTLASFYAVLWLFMQAGSRIGLLGLFLSLALITYIYRKYLLGGFLILSTVIFIATSPAYIDRFKSIIDIVTAKISCVATPIAFANELPATASSQPSEELRPVQLDTSTSIRFDVEWPRAMRSFYKNPILGTGYSSISLSTDNDYLRALGETGILGLLSLLSIIAGLFISLLKKIKYAQGFSKLILVSSLAILVAFSTTALFLDVFESSKIAIIFWSFMAMSLSIKTSKV